MTIKSKLLLNYLIVFLILILSLFYIKLSVANHYGHLKIRQATTYLEHNPEVSMREYIIYLTTIGFYVSEEAINIIDLSEYHILNNGNVLQSNVESATNGKVHVGVNEYATFEIVNSNKQIVAYATLNQSYLNDISSVIDMIILLVCIIFLIFIFILDFAYDSIVLSRLKLLAQHQKLGDKIVNTKFVNNDELSILYTQLNNNHSLIKNEYEYRYQLFKALSHELKTPLTNIDAITKMSKKKFDIYADHDVSINEISIEVERLKNEISRLVCIYDIEIQNINNILIADLIKKLVNDDKNFLINKLNVKIRIRNEGNKYVDQATYFIILNLLSNISKYSLKESKVNISINGNVVRFINVINEQSLSNSSTKVGNKLIEYFATQQSIKLTSYVKFNCFCTVIKF